MKLALITDAWHPQINGVVTTLQELVVALAPLGVQVEVIHPGLFRNKPCPGYKGIDLAQALDPWGGPGLVRIPRAAAGLACFGPFAKALVLVCGAGVL